MKKFLGLAALLAAFSTTAMAADYTDGDIHKNDYKWFQFNIMQSRNQKLPGKKQNDTYLEMEFGGRSGIVDLYGYWDVFDILDSSASDYHEGNGSDGGTADNFFLKFNPRFSIDGMTGKDLSIGPVKEWYVATLMEVGDSQLWTNFIGIGSDIEVPWFGKVGLNAYARFVKENFGDDNTEGEWDGYRISTNWFKPFYFFENGSFMSYQGYVDYDFGMDKLARNTGRTNNSLQWFNGIYWHSDRYAVGYGLKFYNNMAGFKDGDQTPFSPGDETTSGVGHYFAVTYKF